MRTLAIVRILNNLPQKEHLRAHLGVTRYCTTQSLSMSQRESQLKEQKEHHKPCAQQKSASFAKRWASLVAKLDASYKRQQRREVLPDTDVTRVLARHEELSRALTAKGLAFRFDSHLSADWTKGLVDLTADEVVEVMEGMKFLNEYSEDFIRVCSAIEADVSVTLHTIAREKGRYYKGIYSDAVERAFGHGCRSMQAVKRHISGEWPEWPDEWPWQQNQATRTLNGTT